MAVKRIMRYLKGIEDFGLYYKKNEKFELRAYTDADWGGAHFLGRRLVTWTSKKQSCTSQSIAKV